MRTQRPSLYLLFQELRRSAALSGEDRSMQLSHGARVAVRVRDGQVVLSLARKDAPLGDREELTFKANCGVPPGATRLPAQGQQQLTKGDTTYHRVIYRWSIADE